MILRNLYLRSHNLLNFNSKNLKDCLYDFDKLVSDQISCESIYEGWPPSSRIIINESLKPLGRTIFIMNRRLKNGLGFEPTLVFCCNMKPMLMMNRSEFDSFISKLPILKNNLNTFYKQL